MALRTAQDHGTHGKGCDRVAFIHAHATGTGHDGHELAGVRAVFPGAGLDGGVGGEPVVFSSKGWLGHTLGAAGLLSLVLSLECHRARRTLVGTQLEDGCRSVTISQGFGGHIALAMLRG